MANREIDGVRKDKLATVFWGQISLGISIIVFGTWFATQYIAFMMHWHVSPPTTILLGMPIYYPWEWMVWGIKHQVPNELLEHAHVITVVSFLLTLLTQFILVVRRNKRQEVSNTYGSARWATLKELKENALIENTGIILGQTDDARYQRQVVKEKEDFELHWDMVRHGKHLVRHSGKEHVLCFAPTRSGKGVGLAIPTALTWTHSFLCFDPKMELWTKTAGWRRQFSHCIRFFPEDAQGRTAYFNPLLEIRMGREELLDAQVIADMLIDPDSSNEHRDHWESSARMLIVALILHVLYAEEDKSIRKVRSLLHDDRFSKNITKLLTYIRDFPHKDGKPNTNIKAYATAMLHKSELELKGVISTANDFLDPFASEIIAEHTSRSDFTINDLMNAKSPVSLYLVVTPAKLNTVKPILRMIFNLITSRLMDKVDEGAGVNHKHKLLFMLDEFPALGKMAFFEKALSFMAGYGIRSFLIAQDLKQINNAYGKDNSIMGNCHIRVTYGALDEETATTVSNLLGEATVERAQVNFSGGRFAPLRGHVMETIAESERALMTRGDLLTLPGDDVIIMVGGMSPYRGKKVKYYQDDRFSDRKDMGAPHGRKEQDRETQELRQTNNEWLVHHRARQIEKYEGKQDAEETEIPDWVIDAETGEELPEDFLPNSEIFADVVNFSHGKKDTNHAVEKQTLRNKEVEEWPV